MIGINPTHLKDGKGVLYAIVKHEQVDQILEDDNKKKSSNKMALKSLNLLSMKP